MSVLILLITAIIWGVAFIAQSVGMDYIGPFSFNSIRYIIGGIVLIPVVLIRRKTCNVTDASDANDNNVSDMKTTLVGGVCCGICLAVASLLQQFGIMETTVAKAGFITALYIVIVPFLQVLLHKRIRTVVWIAAVIALAGFFVLCGMDFTSICRGDVQELIGAFGWAIHICVIDHFAPGADGVLMSCVQFFVSGIICGIGAIAFETITLEAVILCAGPLLYAGVLSSGVGYTLQIIGQKRVEPAIACLIMSLESVISALAGWIILGEVMTVLEIVGCVLVFAGVILAQLPEKKGEKIS